MFDNYQTFANFVEILYAHYTFSMLKISKLFESNDLAYEERKTTLGSVKLNHVIILSSCDLTFSVQNGCAHVSKFCHYFTDSFCALWHALSEEFCIKDYFSKYGRHVEL